MRLLKLNGQIAELDSKTAIGITFQAYDFKEPGKRKVKVSNSFSLPLTAVNQKIIGFANNVQSDSKLIYDIITCDYWLENEHVIIDAKVRIDEITLGDDQNLGRIKLYVTEKDNIWDELKDFTYWDFLVEFADWLKNEEGENIVGYDFNPNYYSGTYGLFIANQKDGSNLLLPMLFSNFFKYEPGGEGTGFLEDEDNIYLSYTGGVGGHVCVYVKTIFRFLEYKYGVDFLTDSTDANILWNDAIAPNIYIHLRDCSIVSGGTNLWAWQLGWTKNMPPYESVYQSKDKSIYDLVNSYLQLFNVIIDEEIINGVNNISLYRFDDIEDKAPVIRFSDKIDLSKTKFKPKVADYKQINRIKYAAVYPDGADTEGAKELICKNKNLDVETDLFEIDSYYPDVVQASYNDYIVNLSTEESFETWTFLISDGNASQLIEVWAGSERSSKTLQLAAIYGISDEYKFIEKIIEYPKTYEIEKWLSVYDIIGLKFFAQYYIQELNGSFFINKIKGFNPTKSNKPSKIELIRVSDKSILPVNEYLENIWVDGLENGFVDGQGNSFIY